MGDQSVPITFVQGSQAALIRETQLVLVGLHPSITQSVRAVRYFGSQGDPPNVTGGGTNTDSLVRHLCHHVRLRNDFYGEERGLPPDTFLHSKLKVSFPEIGVAAPIPIWPDRRNAAKRAICCANCSCERRSSTIRRSTTISRLGCKLLHSTRVVMLKPGNEYSFMRRFQRSVRSIGRTSPRNTLLAPSSVSGSKCLSSQKSL